jgi:hypothetical protein
VRSPIAAGARQWPGGRGGGERFDEAPGDRRGQEGVSGGDHADRVRELGGLAVFEQESARTGTEGVKDILIEIERGQDQHPDGRMLTSRGELASCLDAV